MCIRALSALPIREHHHLHAKMICPLKDSTMTHQKSDEDESRIMALCSLDGHDSLLGSSLTQYRRPKGPIIAACGPAIEEIKHHGNDVDDINLDHNRKGLAVWEGHIEYSSSYEYPLDVDISWVGKWRGLTPREWDLVRRGEYPWPDIAPEKRWPQEHEAIPLAQPTTER